MEKRQPSADMIIDGFFADALSGQGATARGRTGRVRDHFRRFVEENGESVMVEPDRRMIEAERQFSPDSAVERIARTDDLVFLLPLFITVDRLLPHRLDARAQLLLSRGLLRWMAGLYNSEICCPLHEFEAEYARSSQYLKAELTRER
jgi:hypothetical protein